MSQRAEKFITLLVKQIGVTHVIEIPQDILTRMGLRVGSKIEVRYANGHMTLQMAKKKRYSCRELIKECDINAPMPQDIKDWDLIPPVGKELL